MMLLHEDGTRNAKAAACALLGCVVGLTAGCSSSRMALTLWQQSAVFEKVNQFGPEAEHPDSQWFARIVTPDDIPAQCVHRLSDKFDFLNIRSKSEWDRVVKATNLRSDLDAPAFHRGTVVGIVARVGGTSAVEWPAVVRSVRQRGPVLFVNAAFSKGIYQPLEVPAYVHLAFVPGGRDCLGVKLNQFLFGFDVEISELHEAGIE